MKKWTTQDFPIGKYDLHPDVSINFQMNRFYNWANDPSMLDEMLEVSRSIKSYNDLITKFIALGKHAVQENNQLKAAYYFRNAEFFLPASNPLKHELRKQFIQYIQNHYNISKKQYHVIPYENSNLLAYSFENENPKDTILLFGGFDSYAEELILMSLIFRDAGYSVICFEGPGQGSVLEDHSLPMTSQWEKPVRCVLDYFKQSSVTLIGLSLGGYFSLRAAAYESRVKRVIAFDILANFFDVLTHQFDPVLKEQFEQLIKLEKSDLINAKIHQLSKENLLIEWGVQQGLHVTGSKTPYEFFCKTQSYNTAAFSHLVKQDVLLLAGQNDHYVPVSQLPQQISTLTNARSLTARVFTSEEHADTHCQIGNIGLALDVMINWMEQTAV